MKFLTFTDLHEDKNVLKELLKRASQPDVDFIVCCGDISTFGRGLNYTLSQFHNLGKKFYVIPGNHESVPVLTDAVAKFSNCINFHRRAIKIGDYVFLGYGTDGFSLQDPEFRKVAREWYGKYNGKKVILVTHGPPYGTDLDLLEDSTRCKTNCKVEKRHVGNKDYRKFIERIKPKVVIAGHLHETVDQMDKIGSTRLINPGWKGMIVELN